MTEAFPKKVNHLAEVKRVLGEFRGKGFTVLHRSRRPIKGKWYGFAVQFDKVNMDLAVVFDNLTPEKQVEVCLAVGNKTFFTEVGAVGSFKWKMGTEDFEVLLAGAMYDKVPTRQLYNDGHSLAFTVTIGPDGNTRIERAKEV